MKPTFIQYPKCGTCRKAAAWLREHNIEVEIRDIVTRNPTADELSRWIPASGRPAAKFFNTSGLRYKALNLKDKVKIAPEQELVGLLASEGMLVKRPILVLDGRVLVGFDEQEWARVLVG